MIHHDIANEIPIHLQKTLYVAFGSWLGLMMCLVWNLIAVTGAWFKGQGTEIWLLAVIYIILGVPGSYFLWYRPLYRAMRTDSAIKFSLFFLTYSCHVTFCVFASLAPPFIIQGKSLTGILSAIDYATWNATLAGVYFIGFGLFAIETAISVWVIQQVYMYFRGSGKAAQVPRVLVTCRNQEDWIENCILIHFMLGHQLELTGDENENIPLYYHVVDNFQIQFGKEEFCLVTWLKFGVENWTNYNDEKEPIPFKRRVFCSSLDGRPIRGKNVETLINSEAFKTLDDNDAVSLCCVGILQLMLLGLEDRRLVPNWILRLANDIDGWDNYPWGSHVWPTLYQQLNDANVRRWPALYATHPKDEVDKKSYSITDFAWAYKTWILESFRAATNDYYTRYRRLPRIVAWSSKNKFYRNMLKPFFHEEGYKQMMEKSDDMYEKMSRFMEDMSVGLVPLAKELIIVDQHYEISDLSGF
nr:secretory carrier-associated membrane protein 1-like [Tanacetum cinerariifolium]